MRLLFINFINTRILILTSKQASQHSISILKFKIDAYPFDIYQAV